MKLAVRRTAAALAAVTTAGVSSLAFGAAPALAVPSEGCGPTGDLVAPGICERTYTADGTFTPTATMTKLEVLLVGRGGAGEAQTEIAPGTVGYASAGGGGEVAIVDFSGSTDPLTLVLAENDGEQTSVTNGTSGDSVANGLAGGFNSATATATGGEGGSGEDGATDTGAIGDPALAGGGGADGPGAGATGGAGQVVSALAPAGSLFSGDSRCFGGGGAAGAAGVQGIPGCGGSGPDASGIALIPAAANSGGGGAAATSPTSAESAGAAGVAVVRWNAGNVTLSFDVNGRGTAPEPQTIVAGFAATEPEAPEADGFEFTGWYVDEELTTLADFSAGIVNSSTYYAGWRAALPATGATLDSMAFTAGAGVLLVGVAVFALGARQRRRES